MMCGILRGMIKQNRCQKKDTRWKALYPGGKSVRQYCKNTKVQAGFVVANGLAGQRIRNERLGALSLRLLQRKICLQLACYFLNNSIDF